MYLFKHQNALLFKRLMRIIFDFHDLSVFRMDADALRHRQLIGVRGLDGNIVSDQAMIDISLGKASFATWSTEQKPLETVFPVSDFAQGALENAYKDQVQVRFYKNTYRVTLLGEIQRTWNFQQSREKIVFPEKLPDMDNLGTVTAQVGITELNRLVRELDIVNDLTIQCARNIITFDQDQVRSSKYKVKLERKKELLDLQVKQKAKTVVPFPYLLQTFLKRTSEISDKAVLRFGEDKPLEVSAIPREDLYLDATIRLYITPRVES